MKLYFTRHGKTEWNNDMRLQGMNGDSPLLPQSFKEIEALGKHLSEIAFERVYVSPMKRTRLTAEGIVKELAHQPEIEYKDALKELGLGELEGQKIMWTREKYPEEMHALRFEPDKYDPSPFGGETYEEMLERSMSVVTQAVSENTEGPLLFVSHGATLTGCIQRLAGAPLAEIRAQGGLDNNSLSIIDVTDGIYTLERWNDVSFLDK